MLEYVAQAFSRMVSEYGFAGPTCKRIGHEQYFIYARGAQTISIMIDLSGPPLLELLLPVTAGTPKEVPWAKADGVPRYRRFPKVEVSRKWSATTAANYLNELAAEFERVEHGFLCGPSAPNSPLMGAS